MIYCEQVWTRYSRWNAGLREDVNFDFVLGHIKRLWSHVNNTTFWDDCIQIKSIFHFSFVYTFLILYALYHMLFHKIDMIVIVIIHQNMATTPPNLSFSTPLPMTWHTSIQYNAHFSQSNQFPKYVTKAACYKWRIVKYKLTIERQK